MATARPADFIGGLTFATRLEREVPFLARIAKYWRQGADAEDLVQDTIVRALGAAEQWEPGTNLRAWLTTIMRNQFLSDLARAHRAENAYSEHAAACISVAAHHGDSRLALRDLEKAMKRLPERQRRALLDVGVEGRSYADVAKAAGTSVNGLRCELARARERLREVLGRDAGESPLAPKRLPFAGAGIRDASPKVAVALELGA